MEDEAEPNPALDNSATVRRPRAADWIWRPWYAKLYWIAAALFWSAFLASWIWHLMPDFFRGLTGAYLIFVFHPVTGLVVLGIGFVRAFFSTSEWEWVEPSRSEILKRRSVTGLSDPHSDPADPRSGVNWVGSPRSRARYFGRKWP